VKAPPASTTTIRQPENPPIDQDTMTIPPRSDTNLSFERQRACREAAQRWSELAGGQAAAVASPREPPQHEPSVEERILMMDYTTT
jgi:hypothetical protein